MWKRKWIAKGRRILAVGMLVCMAITPIGCKKGSNDNDKAHNMGAMGDGSGQVTEAPTQPTEPSTPAPTQAPTEPTTAPTTAPTQPTVPKETENNGNRDLGVSAKGYSMRMINGITYVNGILIANKTYALPSSYNPGAIDKTVMEAYNKMKADAAKEGLNLVIGSGYRSYSYQQNLYNNYVKRDGKVKADTYSARAGHSEHQTGLCFDLSPVNDSFANTPESAWVNQHAQEYGFIVRYPKGKESITGYKYEPWHLRYLGVDLATAVYNSGLCLEEYLGIDSVYQEP